ncbi:unnamed protein product [Larinioides sclopetarius]|uniref:Uncharacterized protein n=1 Tax=Larinioides sclopetarius TaxID=280406 RepID=A0AAV1ZZS2_9ARAC
MLRIRKKKEEKECFDKVSSIHHDTSHKEVRRDYCIDKLLEKYSFDINKLRNLDFDILKICPPERKFMEAVLSKEGYGQGCIRFDPCLQEVSKEMKMPCDGEFDRISSTCPSPLFLKHFEQLTLKTLSDTRSESQIDAVQPLRESRSTSRIWNAAAMPCWYLHKY